MVRDQLRGRDIVSAAVLAAMGKTPRHEFVPSALVSQAYEDHPLSIGQSQTISQPYIVALMTQLLDPRPDQRILEIGVGCGYQTAVLAELAAYVYSVEIVDVLAEGARKRLEALGYANVSIRIGDGYDGWADEAPFDGVLAAAAAPRAPEALKRQLKIGGRLVIPLGEEYQRLVLITRTEADFVEEKVLDVRFVPMIGKINDPR